MKLKISCLCFQAVCDFCALMQQVTPGRHWWCITFCLLFEFCLRAGLHLCRSDTCQSSRLTCVNSRRDLPARFCRRRTQIFYLTSCPCLLFVMQTWRYQTVWSYSPVSKGATRRASSNSFVNLKSFWALVSPPEAQPGFTSKQENISNISVISPGLDLHSEVCHCEGFVFADWLSGRVEARCQGCFSTSWHFGWEITKQCLYSPPQSEYQCLPAPTSARGGLLAGYLRLYFTDRSARGEGKSDQLRHTHPCL